MTKNPNFFNTFITHAHTHTTSHAYEAGLHTSRFDLHTAPIENLADKSS